MIYYDMVGKTFEFNNKVKFAHGKQADLFLCDDKVLKVYYESVPRIDYRTFKVLRRIKSRHFIDLIDTYSKAKNAGVIDAYTSYYIDDKRNLESYSTDEFISEIQGLVRLTDFFANFKILMSDVHKDNLIFSDHIKLIDPDKYIICNMKKEDIIIQNRIQLLNALKSYIRENTDTISEERLYNLFNFNKREDIGEQMSLKLRNNDSMTSYLVK